MSDIITSKWFLIKCSTNFFNRNIYFYNKLIIMNHTTLVFTFPTIVIGILIFAIWTSIHVYAQQLSPPSRSALLENQTIQAAPKQQQHITKIKITSPTKGQQVPVGIDLTVSGTSIDNAISNDCKVTVIVNKVRPYQPVTPSGTAAAAGDYSKWNFVLTSKYTTIKPGQNRITAKYDCTDNPALNSFSSVNVTGITGGVASTSNATKTTTPIQNTTRTDRAMASA